MTTWVNGERSDVIETPQGSVGVAPAQFEIEGDVSVISETVREWGESSMEIYSESEGEFELTVTISEE